MAVVAQDVYEIVIKGGAEASSVLAALNARLDEDRQRWEAVARAIDSAETAFREGTTAAVDAGAGLSRTASSLLSVDAATNLVLKGWQALGKAKDILAKPVGLAASFETEVAAIDTVSNRAGTRFAGQFLEISSRLGIEAAQVARAGYEAVGSGVEEATLAQFTDISASLAIAGRAEILPTLKLLTTAKNQFGLSIDEVKRSADVLFGVTKVGTTTIPELANELGELIPLAKAAGLSFDEIGASVAALTKGGLSTALASTQLKSLAVSFQADLPKIIAAVQAAGISIDEAGFKALSFGEKVALLNRAFAGNEQAFKVLGRQESVSALLALGANNAQFYSEALAEVGRSAGATDAALGRMQETTEQTGARLREQFNNQLILLGNELLPQVNSVLTDLTEYLKTNGPELAESIKGGVDQLISLGRWVADNGTVVLGFFGLLAGAKVVGGLVSVASGVASIGGALTGATTLAGGLGTALAVLTSPITIAVAGIAALVAGVNELINTLSSVELGAELDSFANGVSLDIRNAQARVQQEQNRRQLTAGDGVLLDPAAVNQVTGEIGVGLAGNIATVQEALSQGLDIASDLVQRNLAALEEAAATQRSRQDTALANLEAVQAEALALDDHVRELSLEQARGNLLVNQQLTLAVNRQADVQRELAELEGQAMDARAKAANLELIRANLSAQFQQQVTDSLRAALTGIGRGVLGGARNFGTGVVGFLGQDTTPTTPRVPTGRRGRADYGIEDEVRQDEAAASARARIQEAALLAEFVNAERRIGLIDDTNARELRLLALRHAQELGQAEQAGEDLGLLLLTQGQQRLDVLRSQEETAAQVRAQAQADYRTELGQKQQVEALLLAGTDEGAIVALQNRQETELAMVAGNLEAQRELQARHGQDMEALLNEQLIARADTYASYFSSVGQLLGSVTTLFETFGAKSRILTGIKIAGEAAELQAAAIRGIYEGAIIAPKNPFQGAAMIAAGVAAQVQALALYAKAAQFGFGGGGGGGGAGGAGGGGARRTPRLEDGARGAGGQREALTFIFQGDVYDTRRAAEEAFGRRSLNGIRRLADNPRGAPRAPISDFES
jgi:TP901 family phage tail tape measure protein